MTVVVIEPAARAVTAEEAKAAHVFAQDDDDAMVQTLLDVAQAQIDGPGGWLGRAIGEQTLELRIDSFSWTVRLPHRPVSGIVAVEYLDQNGVVQTLDPAQYELADNRLVPAFGSSWPAARCQPGSVRIRYEAGYEASDVPAPIRRAIMLMAAELKGLGAGASGEIRREVVEGVGTIDYQVSSMVAGAMRAAADHLLMPFQVYE